jgi:hypothetical protein
MPVGNEGADVTDDSNEEVVGYVSVVDGVNSGREDGDAVTEMDGSGVEGMAVEDTMSNGETIVLVNATAVVRDCTIVGD